MSRQFLIIILIFPSLILMSFALAFVVAIRKRRIDIWLPAYCKQMVTRRLHRRSCDKPAHILFCFVDHFEPGWNEADLALQRQRVDAWVEGYPVFARQFTDSDGYHPRHTWFYPPHYFREEHILKLLTLCRQGFGEIELHLHHSRMPPFPDSSETLRRKILDCIHLYSRYGIFKTTVNGRRQLRYAFIHGDWALDNSRHGYCGVNDEIMILKETGCYADFTFPSYMIESQPRLINSIYYATDEPDSPKSYDTGERVRVGGRTVGDLLMIQGPLGFRWRGRRSPFFPSVDDGEISSNNPPTPPRVDFWIRTGIAVVGRPEWIIVKVFTHGAPQREHPTLLGDGIRSMHSFLRDKYNDGERYVLHYVTARELFNIVKAAEAGHSGNPGGYRDYLLK